MYIPKNLIDKESIKFFMFNKKIREKTQNILKEKINKYKLSLIGKNIEMNESHSSKPFTIKEKNSK